MKRHYKFIIMICLFALGMGLATPVMAGEKPAGAACVPASALLGVCGDGVCEAYTGETRTSCPSDCAPAPAATFPPTLTPLPTATLPGLLLVNPSATPVASGTPTISEVAIPTSTVVPEDGTEVVLAENSDACGLVAYETRPAGWKKGYTGSSNNFVPTTSRDEEVIVCESRPVGQICIPMYEGLMTAAQGRLDQVVLAECGSDGTCSFHKTRVQSVGGSLCATVSAGDQVNCSTGCAFLPQSYALLGVPVPRFLVDLTANQAFIPAICLVGMLLVGFMVLLIFGRRRRRGFRDEPTTEPSPGVEAV